MKTLNLPAGYDWEYSFRPLPIGFPEFSIEKLQERAEKKVADAFSADFKPVMDFELFGTPSGEWIDNYYGLEIHKEQMICILFASERGRKGVLAIASVNHLDVLTDLFIRLVCNRRLG